jgi:adenylate cyclase
LILPALGGIGFLVSLLVAQFTAASPDMLPSIAVLYTENMADSARYSTFAAGMTEEIINELANVPGLQVISRSDVQSYKGKTVDIQEIGKKLGVSYVLESSLRAEGNQVRLTCQAIQTSDRFHFWSQAYTRELKGGFEVQSDLAKQIAIGLKTKFAQKNVEIKLGLPANSLIK